jgi:hypothetical protein
MGLWLINGYEIGVEGEGNQLCCDQSCCMNPFYDLRWCKRGYVFFFMRRYPGILPITLYDDRRGWCALIVIVFSNVFYRA